VKTSNSSLFVIDYLLTKLLVLDWLFWLNNEVQAVILTCQHNEHLVSLWDIVFFRKVLLIM
jgi:hypothetical protein